MDERDDGELLGAMPSAKAFEELYRRHIRRVVAFAVRRSRTPEDVADLVASTFVAVIESAGSYNPAKGDPAQWILGIASNIRQDGLRKQGRERGAFDRLSGRRLLDPDDHQRLEEAIDAARQVAALGKALDALPAGQRAILELVSEGMAPAEAARTLRINPATARMRLARARRSLRLATPGTQPCVTKDEEVSG